MDNLDEARENLRREIGSDTYGTPPDGDDDEWLPPEIRRTQVGGLRNVNQLKSDIKNGKFDYKADKGRIGGYRDANGVYHVSEGHSRMAAAREIYKETGNAGPMRNY